MIVVQNRIIAPAALSERIEHGFGRQSDLQSNPGFVNFKLLKATQVEGLAEGEVLYVAETTWETMENFDTWRTGESFARAHAGTGGGQGPMRSTVEIYEIKVEK